MTPDPLPEVRLSPLAYTAGHWLPRPATGPFEENDPFDLSAPYQRGSVWSNEQRRSLIRSFIMGVPVGAVIISTLPSREATASGYHWRIVDGKQRVETMRAFVAGQVPTPGWWWREDDCEHRDWSHVVYADLTVRGQRSVDMRWSLPALQADLMVEWLGMSESGKWLTRSRSSAEILIAEAELYALINGGGTPQTEDDMEKAATVARGAR